MNGILLISKNLSEVSNVNVSGDITAQTIQSSVGRCQLVHNWANWFISAAGASSLSIEKMIRLVNRSDHVI